jgi:tetratricopeptide (TPR) repeat protein
LGNIHLDNSSHFEAMTNFERALLYDPDYPPAMIGLARTLLTIPEDKKTSSSRDRAEVLLDSVTKLGGWDSSEAWFWLGDIYERYDMPDKAADCWQYCEQLEERKPIREWRYVRPQWI